MHSTPYATTYYTDEAGRKPFREWFLALKQRDIEAAQDYWKSHKERKQCEK